MTKDFFPAALNVAGRPCLVVGNDREALEKAGRLARAGAKVVVVDANLGPEFDSLAVERLARAFRIDDITDQFLVVYCPKDDAAMTAKVAQRCRERRVLLCAIDQPEFCDVVNVSIFERGHLKISASTGGVSPAAARKIREGLEASLKDVPIEAYFDRLAALRKKLELEIRDPAERRKALIAAVQGLKFSAHMEWPDDGGTT